MFNYIQILVALGAIVLEYETLRNARELGKAKERSEVYKKILMHYPLLMVAFLTFCTIAYIACAVLWIFNTNPLVRVSGIVLMSLTTIGFIKRKLHLEKWGQPIIMRIDSIISMVCLLTVVIVKGILT